MEAEHKTPGQNTLEQNTESRDFLSRLLGIAGIVFVGIYALDSIINTSSVDILEHTTFGRDNPLLMVIGVAAFCFVFSFLFRKIRARRGDLNENRVLFFSMIAVIIVGSVLVVFSADIGYRSDQESCLFIAQQVANGARLPVMPDEGGYLFYYPHQIPWVLAESVVSKAAGANDYLLIRHMNVIFLAVMIFCISRITRLLFHDTFITNTTTILSVFFIPAFLYTLFVYNTMISAALGMLCIYFFLRYISERRIWCAAASLVCIFAAFIIRQTLLIFVVALIIVGVWAFIMARKEAPLKLLPVLLALYVAVCVFTMPLFYKFIENTIEKPVNGGVPSMAIISMGMQEGDLAPGWWNTYHSVVYAHAGYDPALATENSKAKIRDRLAVFSNDPGYALGFYYHKLSSMWNDPTFEGIWILESPASEGKTMPAAASVSRGPAIIEGARGLTGFMNWFHSLILVLAVAGLVMNRRKWTAMSYLPVIIFIGSVLFFLLWEAKSQYSVFYFVFLIPYAASGLKNLLGLFCRHCAALATRPRD